VRRQLLAVPPRRTRWAGVLVVLVVAGVPAMTASAATAATATPAPVLNCVISNSADGTFRAVFGYVNSGPATTVPVGTSNDLSPSSLQGTQTTAFSTGARDGSFVTAYVSKRVKITWTLGGTSVSASWKVNECGAGVTLPTEGNGIGPVVVIALSMGFSFGLAWLRAVRARRRGA
jgi:hypothetical protein